MFYCHEILICLPLWAQSFKLKQVIKWVTYQKENPLYGECVSLAPLGVLLSLAMVLLYIMRMIKAIGRVYNHAHDILSILYLAHDGQMGYNIAILGKVPPFLRLPPWR